MDRTIVFGSDNGDNDEGRRVETESARGKKIKKKPPHEVRESANIHTSESETTTSLTFLPLSNTSSHYPSSSQKQQKTRALL